MALCPPLFGRPQGSPLHLTIAQRAVILKEQNWRNLRIKPVNMMKLSLTQKFTLGFLLVALTAALLMAVSVRWFANEAMQRFLLEQERNLLIEDFASYYDTQNSWAGVADFFRERADEDENKRPPPKNDRPEQHQRPPRATFGMTDAEGTVLVPLPPRHNVNDTLSAKELDSEGTAIEGNGDTIGYVLTANLDNVTLTREEQNFIRFTNLALLIATAVSVLVALILGIVLTRRLTRPVKDLTTATQAMADGELGQQVPVRSQDELGKLASTFNQMSADLARASETRKQMSADIAHDLRSPLTVLAGYLESMEEGVLQPTSERLAAMREEVAHLQHLVTDLRTLSLADAGELSLNCQPLDVAQLLQKTAVSFQQQAQQQQIQLQLNVPQNMPPINADPARMTQLLSNLVINALRHTAENGRIQLKATVQQDNSVQISVQDNGEGIAPQDLAHIFDRFYRADKARHSEQSGMGLAIVKSIVEAHGGKIWATSQLGQGTTFFIELL